MAISLDKTASKAYKKASLNVAETSPNVSSSPYYTEPASPTIVFAENIISNAGDIPPTAPTTDLIDGTMWDKDSVVTTNADTAVIQYNEAVMPSYPGSQNAAYKLDAFDGIILAFNYGDNTYAPAIFENTLAGSQIPFGLNAWEFDPAAGVITFFDGKVPGITANTLGIKFWSYVGPVGTGGAGADVVTKTYALDVTDAPLGAVWTLSTETWVITHSLASSNIDIILKDTATNETVTPDSIVYTDNNTVTMIVRGTPDKSNDTVTYPVLSLQITNVS